MSNTKTTKRPSRKAADEKRPQPLWLQQRMSPVREMPESGPPPVPERLSVAHQSQGPPRLLCKHEVCAIAGATFPSVWAWMRAGTFPRSRVVGGKSMWLSSEIEAWITSLPLRPLKGDSRGPQP